MAATLVHSIRWEITFTSSRFIVVSWGKRWSHRAFPCRFQPWVGGISLLIKKQLLVSNFLKMLRFFFPIIWRGTSIYRSSDVKNQKKIFFYYLFFKKRERKRRRGKHERGNCYKNVSKNHLFIVRFWDAIYIPMSYQLEMRLVTSKGTRIP